MATPFTFDGDVFAAGNPIWSPDGARIAFTTGEAGAVDVRVKDVAGSNPAGRGIAVVAGGNQKIVTDGSPDGLLIYTEIDPATGAYIWSVRIEGIRTISTLLRAPHLSGDRDPPQQLPYRLERAHRENETRGQARRPSWW